MSNEMKLINDAWNWFYSLTNSSVIELLEKHCAEYPEATEENVLKIYKTIKQLQDE